MGVIWDKQGSLCIMGSYDPVGFTGGYIRFSGTHLGSVRLSRDQWRSIRDH